MPAFAGFFLSDHKSDCRFVWLNIGLFVFIKVKLCSHLHLPMNYFIAGLLALAATLSHDGSAQDKPQLDLQRIKLTAGMYLIDAQLAATSQERAIGLMFRPKMPSSEGMLFVFDQPGQQCFWMKNTQLPLTAAFVGDDGIIVNLADMKPLTTHSHCSSRPVRYVLEMNLGWFGNKGIKAGSKLGGLP